jgi:hypothetical protein
MQGGDFRGHLRNQFLTSTSAWENLFLRPATRSGKSASDIWTYCHKSIYPEAQKGMLALNHTFVPLKLDFAEEKGDRGRNETLVCLAPPSEPVLQISRIRLSS